jgi:hypothetical protein
MWPKKLLKVLTEWSDQVHVDVLPWAATTSCDLLVFWRIFCVSARWIYQIASHPWPPVNPACGRNGIEMADLILCVDTTTGQDTRWHSDMHRGWVTLNNIRTSCLPCDNPFKISITIWVSSMQKWGVRKYVPQIVNPKIWRLKFLRLGGLQQRWQFACLRLGHNDFFYLRALRFGNPVFLYLKLPHLRYIVSLLIRLSNLY